MIDAPTAVLDDYSSQVTALNGTSVSGKLACFHCGTLCIGSDFVSRGKPFCCQGCRTVFELLTENGLDEFYQLNKSAGVRVNGAAREE